METTSLNPIASAKKAYEDKIAGHFKPDQRFYDRVGINRKRFGQLLRGEKPLLSHEIRSLADFFGIPATDLL